MSIVVVGKKNGPMECYGKKEEKDACLVQLDLSGCHLWIELLGSLQRSGRDGLGNVGPSEIWAMDLVDGLDSKWINVQ